MFTEKVRSGSVVALVAAGVLLVGCGPYPDEAAPATPTPTSARDTPRPDLRETADPADVPPVQTTPPVIPTNAPGRQDSVINSLPGDASEECVEVGDQRDVRAGSMAAGNFEAARSEFAASAAAAIPFYFIPSATEGDPELVVTLEEVGGDRTDEVRSSEIQTADQWRYYPIRLTIPSAGSWRISASAGSGNTGCWLVDFGG